MGIIDNLEKLLASGTNTAELRFALATQYREAGEPEAAIRHAKVAVELAPDYSAAWRLLGKAETDAGHLGDAAESYRRGIAVAEANGDQQAAKEMRVFLKRLERPS